MLVVCVDNRNGLLDITEGNIYQVVNNWSGPFHINSKDTTDIEFGDEKINFYTIISDSGIRTSYTSIRFKKLTDLRRNKLKNIC